MSINYYNIIIIYIYIFVCVCVCSFVVYTRVLCNHIISCPLQKFLLKHKHAQTMNT